MLAEGTAGWLCARAIGCIASSVSAEDACGPSRCMVMCCVVTSFRQPPGGWLGRWASFAFSGMGCTCSMSKPIWRRCRLRSPLACGTYVVGGGRDTIHMFSLACLSRGFASRSSTDDCLREELFFI